MERNKNRIKFTPQEMGTIVSSVKKGKSYRYFAEKHGVSRATIKRVCLAHGAKSKHGPFGAKPVARPKPWGFWEKLRQFVYSE